MNAEQLSVALGTARTYREFFLNDMEEDWQPDHQGWCAPNNLFGNLIERTRPELIIEVGSWKGKSALMMADEVKRLGFDTKILCIDTWLGATEFIGKNVNDPKRGLQQIAGWPTVFYTFLSNVIDRHHEDVIIPFPQTSVNAARWLRQNNVTSSLIYVDASHEYQDVYEDLLSYGCLLTHNGIMFGDDYCEHWDGVRKAVNGYVDLPGVEPQSRLQTFQFRDPDGGPPTDFWVMSHKATRPVEL